MATFRSFATIDQVFDMLIQRYNIQPPQYLSTDQLSEWTETVRIPTQSRFLNIMRKLIGGLENEDIHILGRVKTFAQEIMLNGPESNGIAETLLYIVQRAVCVSLKFVSWQLTAIIGMEWYRIKASDAHYSLRLSSFTNSTSKSRENQAIGYRPSRVSPTTHDYAERGALQYQTRRMDFTFEEIVAFRTR